MRRDSCCYLLLSSTALAQTTALSAAPASSPKNVPQKYTLKATPKTVPGDTTMRPPRRCCAFTPATRWCSTRCSPTVPRGSKRPVCPPDAGGAEPARYLQRSNGQRSRRPHPEWAGLCRRSRSRGHAGNPHSENRSGHSLRLQRLLAQSRLSAGRFSLSQDKIIPLDRERMVAQFAPGIEIPLHPFFGSMGVAPPEASAASTVRRRGPRRQHGQQGTGRGHNSLPAGACARGVVRNWRRPCRAGQWRSRYHGAGNLAGGHVAFVVHKGTAQKYPRAETPTHYISMGFHQELYEATRIAVREMIDFLVTEKHLSRDDAYMLVSVAGTWTSPN